MPSTSMVLGPHDLKVLTRALNKHCEKLQISDEHDRAAVAAEIIRHFQTGVTTVDELLEALERKAI